MVIVDGELGDWEGWPADQVKQRGDVQWKTLISAGQTDSEALTAGVARLAPNGRLCAHHHAQPEVYVILEGAGVVTIDGVTADVAAGATVFIPGSVVHAIEAGEVELRFAYVLAADAFTDVTYVFDALP